MTQYLVSDKKILEQKAQAYAFLMYEDQKEKYTELEKIFFPHLTTLLKEKKMVGAKGQTFVLPCAVGKEIVHLLFVGMGKKDAPNMLETFRSACALIVRLCQANKLLTVAYELPKPKAVGVSDEKMGEIIASISEIAQYKFDQFVTNPDEKIFYLR